MSPTPTNAEIIYRVSELEKDVKALQSKVDRLMWALLSLALSISASAVVFAITTITTRGR